MKTELGDYVRRRRIEQGKTIRQLAEITHRSWRTIHSVENGDSRHPSRDLLEAIAQALDEDVSVLALKVYAPACPS